MTRQETEFTVERTMNATADVIYEAWTQKFDTWFASPGAIRMSPIVGEPYWFEVIHNGERHPHYGRFLALEPGRLVEQTWVTGRRGTDGAETIVRIELVEVGSKTRLRLTHRGFFDGHAAQQHAGSWPQILAHLDESLASSGATSDPPSTAK